MLLPKCSGILLPLLFILVMEILSRMLSTAVEGGYILGFQVGASYKGITTVSHLLFADDTILFCDDNMEQLGHIRAVLECFEAVSGLRVNLRKSELVLVGDVERVEELARTLGCREESLPMKYLGYLRDHRLKPTQFGNQYWKKDWLVGRRFIFQMEED